MCTSLFSLLLCDSNASMVLILAYMIVYIVYQFFAAKDGLSPAKVTMRIVALVLVGTFLVGSSLMFREICQQGFAVVTAKTYSLLDEITEKSSRIPMNSQSKMIPTIIKPLRRPTKGR